MKQQKTFSLVAFAMLQAALLLSACSSEENIPASGGIAVTDAHINISVAPFETSSGKAKTRAGGTDETKADTVLLANGMRAICTVEEDDEAEQTRAPKPIADGHYTIYACDPVTGNRITGPDKLLKGTVTGGVFQSDGGTRLFLDPGTYKFVCFNDAVEDNGTYLSINTGMYGGAPTTYYPSAGDAQIGTATETISGDNWQVNFTMRHQNTRVRQHIIAYSDHMDNAWGCVYGGNKEQPMFRRYAVDGTFVSQGGTPPYGYVLSHFKMPATSTDYNATYVRAHDFYSDYMYLTSGIDIVAGDIACVGNSRLYGKQIPGNGSQKKVNALQNHSYTVTYRILPDALYLFEDGSCGALAEKGSRKVIGVVAKEKTNSEDGTAAAISHVKGGTVTYIFGTNTTILDNQRQYNDADFLKAFRKASETDDGYNNTWGVSHDGVTIKANEQTRYPAFYAAAHYGDELAAQGITLTGNMVGRKWFLPSVKEWVQLFNATIPSAGLGAVLFDFGQAMTAAGGTYKGGYSHLVTSSEWDAAQYLELYASTGKAPFNMWSTPKNANYNQPVLPFIHF